MLHLLWDMRPCVRRGVDKRSARRFHMYSVLQDYGHGHPVSGLFIYVCN
jgi:hypothetical protein